MLPVVAYAPGGSDTLRESMLAPYVSAVADLATRLVPDELSEKYRQRMHELKRHWRERSDDSRQIVRSDG